MIIVKAALNAEGEECLVACHSTRFSCTFTHKTRLFRALFLSCSHMDIGWLSLSSSSSSLLSVRLCRLQSVLPATCPSIHQSVSWPVSCLLCISSDRRLSRKRSQMSLDRLKRSLSMEPLHELSTSAGAANQTWKSSSFKRDTLSVDMAISQTPVHVPSVEVTSSRIIAETIPEEIERKRRESMKPAPGEFSEFVVGADEIKIETHLASPLEEEEDHGRLTGLEDKVHLRDDRPNSTESVMSAHRKDEGLGESFDQYSEVSDSLSRNGNLNTDTVPHTDDGMQPVTLSPTDSPSNSPARLMNRN
ncbi:uncharacterized protein LOC124275317 isoform X2 [Haliotis rubra]|uniref:uncharacterized protein LOC124275317 isoform X2 n=1 Tax=Haliotis rubra TaxID=36100 RepID=UPI001EE52C9E|nr:uncharacterized protein LOC124275317 isoform X2 [Haliotis rubra]